MPGLTRRAMPAPASDTSAWTSSSIGRLPSWQAVTELPGAPA